MSEDASISRQLSNTVRTLKVVVDLNLEYSVLSSIIELIPVLLTECQTVVHSLYDVILPNEILEAAWKKSSINKDTAKHVYSEVWIQHDVIAVVYYVSDYAKFSLYRLDFLPVLVGTGKTCVKVDSKPYLVAISMEGQFFDYNGDNCVTDVTSVVCSLERVTIRKSPKTCVEKLAVGEFKTLPTVCNEGLKLSLCENQEYFRQGLRTYIFSPFNDTVIVDCAGKQNWLPMKAGTFVVRSSHCLTSTSDLLIPSTGIVGKPILVTGVMKDFENTLIGLDSVLDDISVSHTISLSKRHFYRLFWNQLKPNQLI